MKRRELGYSALHTIETSFTLVPVFPVITKEFSCLKKYSGIVKDIDNSGGLILERDDKLLEIIYSGEITIREQNDR